MIGLKKKINGNLMWIPRMTNCMYFEMFASFIFFNRISCHTRSELDVSCSFLRHQTWRDTASGVDPELPRDGPYLCDKKQESHWDKRHNSFSENCYYVVLQNNNVQKQYCLDHLYNS